MNFVLQSHLSSRSKIGIKLEGTAFIRREGLLLPCRASLILSQKIFPKTFNVPGRGVMLSFLGKISSSLRKGIVIDVSSVRFLTGTKESRRAFLEHIIGLVRENAERTVAAGFPELSEDFCAFDSLTVSFEKAGISPGEAMKALYRCIMTVSTGELKKLLSRGFSDNEAGRRSVEQCCAELYYKYCFDALFRLRNDPYILLCSDEEADEKSLGTAGPDNCDLIASTLGFRYDSPERIDALISYVFSYVRDEGNTGISLDDLMNRLGMYKTFGQCPEKDKIIEAIKKMSSLLYLEDSAMIADRDADRREQRIAEELLRINSACVAPILNFGDEEIYALLDETGTDHDKYAAVKNLCLSNISIVTGRAGTGKSKVIELIVDMCKRYAPELKISICATTGKAAGNLSDGGKLKAVTVHSLLHLDPSRPSRFPQKTDDDIVILDEASMLDPALAVSLFSSIKTGARLVMVGDNNQLPPVEGGRVFADIAESGVFPCLTLTTNYRQRGSFSIIAASQQIKKGESVLAQDDYFRMKRVDGDRAINAYLADIIPRRFNREHPFGLQVIVPLNRYRSGVNGINRVLQNVLNAGGKEIKAGMMSFREGDKVVFSNTRYSRHHEPIYVNGQTGIITDVRKNPMKITIRTQNGQVSLGYSEIINGNLSLAYAMTIHKSQGSQFDEVFVVLPEASENFVTRNMLYTAVTRAVKSLTVVYSGKGPSKAIANNSTRLTFLRDKLIDLWAKLK